MATITTAVYLDGGTARTAGEAMTINSGGSLTIRTDTRVHANAPVSMTGSLGAITVNEGLLSIDAQNVRWIPYNSGTGNVPAIGTSITQGAVSGYLLGVWATLLTAPTAPASAMPTSGYIKFREVTGGTFTSGALTGIGASATSPDVAGWIEVVHDQSVDITVPRLGRYQTRGNWFYLDNTNGTRGQVLQTPVNGGGANTYVPGVWIETGVGTDVYDHYPALNGATNGWAIQHIGAYEGGTDKRHRFCKMLTNGQMQLGETITQASTYASLSAQASTYATIAVSCTYTWANNIVTVYASAGHGLYNGQQTGLDFTSGGATANDNIYTVTVLDGYYFTVALSGSGASGNVTSRPGVLITFTAHGLSIGNQVYCDFTTGTGVDGTKTVYAVPSANTYSVEYPHIVALTSGNVSCLHTLVVTFTAHGLAVGNRVYLDFTSGAGVDGVYTIRTVATNTYNVNFPHSTAITTSNVTARFDLGYVPVSGCKTRIPNIITRQVATGARATNVVPNATIASRPEFITTSAGAIDLEYFYDTGFYTRFGQPYSVRAINSVFTDTLEITECATALDIDNVFLGMQGAQDLRTLQLTSNFAGGTIQNSTFSRGNAPGTTDHCVELSACQGQTLSNVDAGIVQFARSTGYPINVNSCNNITLNNCRVINGNLRITTCNNVSVSNLDYVDRFTGYTNATAGYYAVYIETKSNNITINGITFGYNGSVLNVHPYAGLVGYIISDNIKVRNAGTFSTPLLSGSWEPHLYALGTIIVSGGNSSNLKFQRIYFDKVRTAPVSLTNSDKGMLIESIKIIDPYQYGSKGLYTGTIAALNCEVKGLSGYNVTTGNASVYGSHFEDFFGGMDYGRFVLTMNEPTTETTSQFTMVSGTAKFNSSGGILMGTIGNQAIWEDPFFRLGHTGFVNVAPTMSGGTITNYTVEYQIDLGSGYNGTWKTLNGANLSAETITVSIGFRLKIRITTTSTNTTAITFLRIDTFTSSSAQSGNLYALDSIVATISLTGLQPNSEVVIYRASDGIQLATVENSGTTFSYQYTWLSDTLVNIVVVSLQYEYLRFDNILLTSSNSSIPVQQRFDRNYANPA